MSDKNDTKITIEDYKGKPAVVIHSLSIDAVFSLLDKHLIDDLSLLILDYYNDGSASMWVHLN